MVEPTDVLVGDFDRDGTVTESDLNLFAERSREDALVEFDIHRDARPFDFSNNIMDLNNDNFLNDADRQLWLTHVANTTTGDSDLDGDVDLQDFLPLASMSPSSWSQGDYDGNNETNFLDFLALANNFGNEGVSIAAVPEPSSSLLALLLVAPTLLSRRRRSASSFSRLCRDSTRLWPVGDGFVLLPGNKPSGSRRRSLKAMSKNQLT